MRFEQGGLSCRPSQCIFDVCKDDWPKSHRALSSFSAMLDALWEKSRLHSVPRIRPRSGRGATVTPPPSLTLQRSFHSGWAMASQKRKISPAAKYVFLAHYGQPCDIPRWSDIGSLVQVELHDAMIDRLRYTQSGDVADYLMDHREEAMRRLHQRLRSLRETRNSMLPKIPLITLETIRN